MAHTRLPGTVMAAAVLAGLTWASPPAAAQTLTLSLSPSTISFPSADPDTTPTVASGVVAVTYGVRDGNANDTWTLTIIAEGDLDSGQATIPVTTISWTATAPFQNGTLSRAVAQTMASGISDVKPAKVAYVTFWFANSWTHNAGVYSQVLTLTLTSQ